MKKNISFGWSGLSLSPVQWLFTLSLLGLPLAMYWAFQLHSVNTAEHNARQLNGLIAQFRRYYSDNVAGRIINSHGTPITLTERYREVPGGIPIPATLSIEMGELLQQRMPQAGFGMAFVSDAPFRGRQRPPLDRFQAQAIAQFRLNPEQTEIWRQETRPDGGQQVRMAIPVRMSATCVSCHNGHPDSPVRDWKVGDVRGLQDVTVALSSIDPGSEVWGLGLYLLFFAGTAVATLREHRRAHTRLALAHEELQLSQSYLEDSEQQLQQKVDELTSMTEILQRAPFGIAIADARAPGEPLVYVNHAFEQMTGYHADEVLGHNCRQLQGPDSSPEAIQRIRDAIAQRRASEIEILNYRKDGSTFWNRFLIFPSHDSQGQLLHFVGCLTDISALKQGEQERQQMEAELQESMKLESLALTIAGIAHDLNTPIGVAVTAASHLERQAHQIDRLTSADNQELPALRKASQSLLRSAQLIGNNLQKAATLVRSFKQTTANASRTEWSKVDLRAFLDSLIVSVSPLLRRQHCQVELLCPAHLQVYTETGALTQVISNLLINATLHAFDGQADRQIRVAVTPDAAQLLIEVADNGKGMSEEAMNKAFSPFFTTRRHAGGSGLGLFSSRRAVEQVLGGRISVTSTPGHGTTFHIVLPLKPPPVRG